jgi:hypothetical protein
MPEDESENDSSGSDLPDPSSGETFSDLDSLKETLSDGGDSAEASDPDSTGGEDRQAAEADSGESGGSEEDTEDDSSGGSDTVRMTFHIDRETAERLRNAVYWTGAFVTLSGTARDALRAAVEQLEEQFNDGEPFPDRDEELRGGNPNLV